MATDTRQSMPMNWTTTALTLWHQRHPTTVIWALAAVAVAVVFGLAYVANFFLLVTTWSEDLNYSHGFLVLPIAAAILWYRLTEKVRPAEKKKQHREILAPWWGWVFLTTVLAIRAIAYERNQQWLENATILPAIASLIWTLGGWPLMRRIWQAVAYLVFMLPLPQSINNLISLPLQRLATSGSCFLLQLSGLWAIQEGNVINLHTPHGMMPLDVAIACNGLRMLMTMVATVIAIILLLSPATWKQVVLLVSCVPIALLSNMIRIFTTGWCYYLITGPNAKEWAHDVTGWFMMPVALALAGLELCILSWLVPDEKEPQSTSDRPKSLLPLLAER